MSGPQIFLVAWSVIAIGLGNLFFFKPEVVERRYREQMDSNRLTRDLRERYAPTERVIIWYRVGGVIAAVMGLIIGTLALLGVLPPDSA